MSQDFIRDIFDRGAEARLDRETERATIALAQYGDQDATLALCYAYAPVLRSLAAKHAARLGAEEARATAIAGLMEAIHAFDLSRFPGQLAGIVGDYVSNALRANDDKVIMIPEATKRRYFLILRQAHGDLDVALTIAQSSRMGADTFAQVREALSATSIDTSEGSFDSAGRASSPSRAMDHATPVWVRDVEDEFSAADTAALAAIALDALDELPRDVIEHAYGFVTYEPLSDGEVAQAISVRDLGAAAVAEGQTVLSRAKAQRIRSGALATMRAAIGA